jgi:hypothetical protein
MSLPELHHLPQTLEALAPGDPRPHLFEGVANAINPDVVAEPIARLQRAHADHAASTAHLRVYVGEDRLDDLVERALRTPVAGTDLRTWGQRVTGADRFSMVINNLETLSDHASRSFAEIVRTMLAPWGLPMGGCEQVAFIGNYSATAFGVHRGFEDALLVHLGPGVKHFYCWSAEHYIELTGSLDPTFGDFTHLLDDAELFNLVAGDVLYLPRGVFHVGIQEEMSVSVAIPLYTYPADRYVLRSVLAQLINEFESSSTDDNSRYYLSEHGAAPLCDDFSAVADRIANQIADQLTPAVAASVEDRWNLQQSNGGWEVSTDDLAREDASVDPTSGRAVRPGRGLEVRAPFKLVIPAGASSRHVYLRGRRVAIEPTPATLSLLDALRIGPITAPSDPYRLGIIRSLAATGGLRTTKEQMT